MILPGSQFPIMGRPLVFEEVQSLPPMTSNTSPAGHVASASSTGGGVSEPYLAFDQAVDTNRWASAGGGAPVWLMRETPDPIKVWKYVVRSGNTASTTGPSSFILQGSHDGATFDDLDSRAGQVWTDFETKSFEIAAPYRAYRHHRLFITSIAGGNIARVSELELLQVF